MKKIKLLTSLFVLGPCSLYAPEKHGREFISKGEDIYRKYSEFISKEEEIYRKYYESIREMLLKRLLLEFISGINVNNYYKRNRKEDIDSLEQCLFSKRQEVDEIKAKAGRKFDKSIKELDLARRELEEKNVHK